MRSERGPKKSWAAAKAARNTVIVSLTPPGSTSRSSASDGSDGRYMDVDICPTMTRPVSRITRPIGALVARPGGEKEGGKRCPLAGENYRVLASRNFKLGNASSAVS